MIRGHLENQEHEIFTWEDFFPYELRPLQSGLIKTISKGLVEQTHVILEAANGTGKTVASLTAVLPFAKQFDKKIIYVARTHNQLDRVVEELNQISKKQKVSGIALRGREAFCLNKLVLKHAKNNHAVQVMCAQLKSAKKCTYFTNMKIEARILPVINELTSKPASAEIVYDLCQNAELCPAETARKVLTRVDVIACSYLYLFDPMIRKTFLEQLNRDLEDIILIIDEAHNLPEMLNLISSATLSTFSFNRAIREARDEQRADYVRFFNTCVNYLNSYDKKLKINDEKGIDPSILLEDLELKVDIDLDEAFFEEMVEIGEKIRFRFAKAGKEPRSSLGRVGDFFYSLFQSIGRKNYTHSIQKQAFQDSRDSFLTLKLDALDPSVASYPVLKDVYSSISMSGTIGNPEAYNLLLGLNRLKHFSNIFPSPYKKSNIQTVIPKDLTTLYAKRTPKMWKDMVAIITEVVKNTPKNVGIFTPSYAILNQLMKHGLENHIYKPIYEAKSGMSSLENDKLVEKFKRHADGDGAVLCSVLGGRSSEGADFPGDLMQSVIVVGIPFAPPTHYVNAAKAFMEEKFPGKGTLLSYQIPAINRAAQAAGRPVRGLKDQAFIVLLDYRFGQKYVSDYLPEWIRSSMNVIENSPKEIASNTSTFFRS